LPAYRVESSILEQPDDIKPEWIDLQSRSDCSYFQAWGWIETWLKQIAIQLQPVVIKVWSNNDLVGIGLFVSRDIRRRMIIHSRAMLLNEYPFEGKNMVIEYNGLLVARGHEKAVYTQAIEYLLKEYTGHDEFYFGAIEGRSLDYLSAKPFKGADCSIDEESSTWSVDLDTVPQGIDGYLDCLSKNRRAQIRRCMRIYQERGSLQIEEPRNLDQAMHFFEQLKVLHTERWQSCGEQGSFANRHWESFHRSLINSRFNTGEIQLLRVHNGHEDIGYLYNFVWHKHVYVLQTGFKTSTDKRLMPGYVTHALAITYNKQKDMIVYDFMHGDLLYKRILCNQNSKLYWAVIRRQQPKFVFEKLAVAMVRSFRRVVGRENA